MPWPDGSCADCQWCQGGDSRYLWVMHEGCSRDGLGDMIGFDDGSCTETLARLQREDLDMHRLIRKAIR